MDDAPTCRIRPMTGDDLPAVLEWRNHPNIARYMLTRHEITADEHRRWFAGATKDPSRRLLIVELGHVPFGFVQFSGVATGEAADWGFYVAPDAPKGRGRMLGTAALDLAFTDLGLNKVCGQAVAGNESSIGFHKSLGFQQEGILRSQIRVGADYLDLICFGLLSSEWRPASSKGFE